MTTNTAKSGTKAAVGKKRVVVRRTNKTLFAMQAPSLADVEMKSAVRTFRNQKSHSPEAASKFLRSMGMLTPSGRLSKTYGG